jgi:hypothetical protein
MSILFIVKTDGGKQFLESIFFQTFERLKNKIGYLNKIRVYFKISFDRNRFPQLVIWTIWNIAGSELFSCNFLADNSSDLPDEMSCHLNLISKNQNECKYANSWTLYKQ